MKYSEFKAKIEKDPQYILAMNRMKFRLDLANAVLGERLKQGMTIKQLSKVSGVKRKDIIDIESATFDLTEIEAVLDWLDIDVEVKKP